MEVRSLPDTALNLISLESLPVAFSPHTEGNSVDRNTVVLSGATSQLEKEKKIK